MWILLIVQNFQGQRGGHPLLLDVLALPVNILMLLVGEVLELPVLAWPLLAAAITVEAWTRPEESEQSPLARPRVQLVMVAILVTITGVALCYLRASWSVDPGTSWVVP
jgi:hypothetical protein